MIETYTWSDLQAYWQCPRAWAYRRLGFAVPPSSAMLRGTIVHAALAAFWSGKSECEAMVDIEAPQELLLEASRLVDRYLQKYGKTAWDVEAVEKLFIDSSGVGGHPDLVANWPLRGRIVIDYKTSDHPDIDYLSASPQTDYYAVLIEAVTGKQVDFVFIDIISPEYITRIERKPRKDRGALMLYRLRELAGIELRDALDDPHFTYDCRRCPYLRACKAREEGGDDRAILEHNFGGVK